MLNQVELSLMNAPMNTNRAIKSIIRTRQPELVDCHHCQLSVQSDVKLQTGKGQLLFAAMLIPKAIFCCVVPLLMSECKDAIHHCPLCKEELGRKNFIFE